MLIKPLSSRSTQYGSPLPIMMPKLNNHHDKASETTDSSYHRPASSPPSLQHTETSQRDSSIKNTESLSNNLLIHSHKSKMPVSKITPKTPETSPLKKNTHESPSNMKSSLNRSFRRFSIKKMAFEGSPMKSPKRQAMPSAIPVPKEGLKRRISNIPQSIHPIKLTQSLLKKKNSNIFETSSNHPQRKIIHMSSLINLSRHK